MQRPWTYKGKPFTSEMINGHYGFVYLITNMATGRMYVGRKYFWSKRKRSYVESNWQSYYGSSEYLLEDVEKLGEENFSREILSLHGTKGITNYMEVKEQFARDVLAAKNENGERLYYNANILNRYFVTLLDSFKGRTPWNKGKKTGHEPANKGKKRTYKEIRITNGEIEKNIRAGTKIPDGWRRGTSKKGNNKHCTVFMIDGTQHEFQSASEAKKHFSMKQSTFETLLLDPQDPKVLEYKKRRAKNKDVDRIEYKNSRR